jgi:hypothetical protein
MNIEEAEHIAVKKAVDNWCKVWNVDTTKLAKTYGIDEKDHLTLELSAPLRTPITKVKTKLTIINAEDEASTGPGTYG